jgi:rhamnose transport system ATP-binding protein
MVGRPLDQVYPRTRHRRRGGTPHQNGGGVVSQDQSCVSAVALGQPPSASAEAALLQLDGLTRHGMFHDVSFTLRRGEILGLTGLVGAGRSELARAIYGLYPCHGGVMRLRGQPWKPKSPRQALPKGLVYLPEERKRQGLVPDHSVSDSISVGFSDLLIHWGMIRGEVERRRVQSAMSTYDVRARSPHQAVGTLSGGNQQKAMLARWLEREPEVIVLDEPTRGVDVGAKAEIHQLIDRLAGKGCGVLLISSDLPEVLGMSDRVLVMNRGGISAELRDEKMTQENVLLAASGLLRPEPA